MIVMLVIFVLTAAGFMLCLVTAYRLGVRIGTRRGMQAAKDTLKQVVAENRRRGQMNGSRKRLEL